MLHVSMQAATLFSKVKRHDVNCTNWRRTGSYPVALLSYLDSVGILMRVKC